MDMYYRSSGKVHASYAVFFIAGLIPVVLLSVLYAIAMYYMPTVYLCFAVTGAFTVAAAYTAAKTAEWGKVRNAFVGVVALLIYFAAFTYVHLTAYVAVVFRDEAAVIDLEWFWLLLRNPSVTLEGFTDWIVPYGVWSFTGGSSSSEGTAVSGTLLVVIWLIEHCIVLGGSIVLFNVFLRKPFFEDTGRWGTERTCASVWEHRPEAEFGKIREALEGGRLDYFGALKAADSGGDRFCRLSCWADPFNESRHVYLTLTNITVTTDKKGNAKTSEDEIVRDLIISEASYRQLEQMAEEAGKTEAVEDVAEVE
ncbi:MAG: hypothetical protein LBI19_02415 [Oscillospiraceae bacterium]|jgi:hypothetical protein|nr:hypothetical protein [Oscillospiraceae bacterium]